MTKSEWHTTNEARMTPARFRLRHSCLVIHSSFLILVSSFLMVSSFSAAAELNRAIDIRTLPYERSLEKLPVDLTATIGFIESATTAFVQDDTAGTHLHFKPGRTDLHVGDQVRIRGTTTAGLYFPGVDVTELVILGHAAPPAAVPAAYDDLATGRFHYQRVVVEGLGRTLTPLDENRSLLRLAMGSRVIEVRVDSPPESAPDIVDARLRITALAAGGINDRRQLVFPYLRVTDWSDVTITQPAKPFTEKPWVSVTNLLRFTGKPDEAAQSVRVHGLVLASFPDGRLYARDQNPATPPSTESGMPDIDVVQPAICIRLGLQYELNPGDNFVATGFPVMEGFTASLADARLLEVASGPAPEPVRVTLQTLLDGSHDADLVQLDHPVTLLDHFRTANGYELRIDAGGTTLRAFMPRDYFVGSTANIVIGSIPSAHVDSDGNLALEKGAMLAVTGICQIESTTDKGFRSRPALASLLLRGPADLLVLNPAPFWNAKRLIIAIAILGGIILLTLFWITQQRRQITRLERKIAHQATLDERQRIAREFHDTLEQELTGLSLRLDAATTRPLEDKARGLLETSRNLVSRIQSEARNLVSDLRDTEHTTTLPEALQLLASRAPETITIKLDILPIPPIPPHVTHHLRMIAQEAVTNALKHAQATEITLHLSSTPTILTLRITDNGRGFDPTAETHGKPGHFGCIGIRERARKVGADVKWESTEAKGTSVCLSLPLAQ
ncbi:MAG: sensor histidine kinase [Verrucomicrobiaceae bacterium]